jgi:hypothetical protein
MNDQELHEFGLQAILPYVEKEGLTIQAINSDSTKIPQIVGERWGSLAYVFVRTSCFPQKGSLDDGDFLGCLHWANTHAATAFFASVGVRCVRYPDDTPVNKESEMGIPYKNASYHIAYDGLLIMTTTDRVKVWGED